MSTIDPKDRHATNNATHVSKSKRLGPNTRGQKNLVNLYCRGDRNSDIAYNGLGGYLLHGISSEADKLEGYVSQLLQQYTWHSSQWRKLGVAKYIGKDPPAGDDLHIVILFGNSTPGGTSYSCDFAALKHGAWEGPVQ